MKSNPLQVKVEQDLSLQCQPLKYNQPFKIQLVQVQQKPQFIPFKAYWTNFENAKYCAFISHHEMKMQGISHSNLWPLYEEMSLFIGSRNFRQCKTYHHRMLQKFKTIKIIVNHFKSTIENFDYLILIEKEALIKYLSENSISPSTFKPYQAFQAQPYENLIKFSQKMKWIIPSIQHISQKQSNLSKQPSIYHISSPDINFEIIKKQNDWIQCHGLFMAWSNCLLELQQMNPSF